MYFFLHFLYNVMTQFLTKSHRPFIEGSSQIINPLSEDRVRSKTHYQRIITGSKKSFHESEGKTALKNDDDLAER